MEFMYDKSSVKNSSKLKTLSINNICNKKYDTISMPKEDRSL